MQGESSLILKLSSGDLIIGTFAAMTEENLQMILVNPFTFINGHLIPVEQLQTGAVIREIAVNTSHIVWHIDSKNIPELKENYDRIVKETSDEIYLG